MLSFKRIIVIAVLLGVVVGVLADGYVSGLVASLSAGLVLVLVVTGTTSDQDTDFGLLTNEEERGDDFAPAPEPAPK